MSEPSRSRYGDKEVNAIIKRAVEMQQAPRQPQNAEAEGRTGITLEQLQNLAAEAGIDPQMIAAAAAEFDAGQAPDEKSHFLGAPAYTEFERIVEGTVPDDGWQDLAAGLRKHLGDQGTVSHIGHSLEWRGPAFRIWVASKGGQTTLRVRSGGRFHPIGVHVLTGWLAVLGAPLTLNLLKLSDSFVFPAIVGALGGAFLLGRWLAKLLYRKRRQALHAVLDGLAEAVTSMQPAEASSAVTERVRQASVGAATDEQLSRRGR